MTREAEGDAAAPPGPNVASRRGWQRAILRPTRRGWGARYSLLQPGVSATANSASRARTRGLHSEGKSRPLCFSLN